MKYRTKLHFRHMNLNELTNVVTLIAITGELTIVCLHEYLSARILGGTLLFIALLLAIYVFKNYHYKHMIKTRKKIINEKLAVCKHKIKHNGKTKITFKEQTQ